MKLLANLAYAALWLIGYLFHVLPFFVRKALASTSAFLLYRVLGVRRKVVLHNLIVGFPREKEESNSDWRRRLDRIAFAHYVHLGLVFIEILERFHWNEKVLAKRVSVEGIEHIRLPSENGLGIFFVSGHLGNWELITMAGRLLGVPVSIITRYLRNRFADALWKRSRVRYGIELLEESGSGFGILKALKAGRAVGFIFDQYTGPPHGVEASFLGLRTWCPKGLAILSQRLEVPVLPAYMLREPDGRFRLVIEAPLALPAEGIEAHVLVCNQNIEKWIRAYPEQYLWIHKRFKGVVDYGSELPW